MHLRDASRSRTRLSCALALTLALGACGGGPDPSTDAGPPDDAGSFADTGTSDAGPDDASTSDDGGPGDAGPEDGGDLDGGPVEGDAGPVDGGPAPCGPDEERVGDTCLDTPASVTDLALWLRSDVGVTCVGDRVTTWADQSGSGRNATVRSGSTGPACGSGSGEHDGRDVVHFAAGGEWSVAQQDQGVLQVDLSALESMYTAFVVVRRVGPPKLLSYVLGAGYPSAGSTTGCTGTAAAMNNLRGPHIGWRASTALRVDHGCELTDALEGTVRALDEGAPFMEILTVRQRRAPGMIPVPERHAWSNGDLVLIDLNSLEAFAASEGRIGRGFGNTALDTRFRGDVAEVVIFDRGLGGAPGTSTTEIDRVYQWLAARWL